MIRVNLNELANCPEIVPCDNYKIKGNYKRVKPLSLLSFIIIIWKIIKSIVFKEVHFH